MAFQLHEQRERWVDESLRAADVEAYFRYLEAVRPFLPTSAHTVATDRHWYGFDGYGPHDSALIRIEISDHPAEAEGEPPRKDITIFLRNGEVREIRYRDVLSYELSTKTPEGSIHGYWMYDEFALSGNREFTHMIEWNYGPGWIIRAREIEVIR